MSIRVQSYVWEHSKAEGSALLLLLAIADFSHDDGTGAYPSVETLAAKCRQSERNTQLLLRKLEGMGELVTKQQASPYGTNLYSIPMGGAKISGVQSSAEIVHQISPNPSLESNNTHTQTPPENEEIISPPTLKQTYWKEFVDAFEKHAGFVSPALYDKWSETFDRNSDLQAERQRASIAKLNETRNAFKAIDAFREYRIIPPRASPVKSSTPPDPNRGIVTEEKRAALLREHLRLKAENRARANAP